MAKTKGEIIDMFEDWFNNFLTIKKYAEYYDISENRARRIIRIGRVLWNKRAEKLKKVIKHFNCEG